MLHVHLHHAATCRCMCCAGWKLHAPHAFKALLSMVFWHLPLLLAWQNMLPCPAAGEITFYGGSFIADPTGAVVAQVGARPAQHMGEFAGSFDPTPAAVEGFVIAEFDLHAMRRQRLGWGLFRDRRPELYGAVCSLDGVHRHAAA